MAKVELAIPFDKMSGKLDGNSTIYATTRYGKTVFSHYPKHKDPKSLSARQRELNANFGQISKQAKQELADPERRAYWQSLYDEYKTNLKPSDKYYFTLRGFVIGQMKKL
jgi:hypothetical protein